MGKVLVTGGSGFLSSHCIVQLLQAGHEVRTTLRGTGRSDAVKAMVRAGGADPEGVAYAVADLRADAGWADAVADCDHVLHVASPLPRAMPNNADDLIVPAREGTLRVLRAARDAGVSRVVVTSSFAAVGYGNRPRDRPFDETDWTDPDGADVQPYARSKAVAEQAAWDFIAAEGGVLELAAINPTVIFGPVLGPDYSASISLIRLLMDGRIPATPRIALGVVDVRDVADLHIRAMLHPAAAGERFIAVSGPFLSLHDIALTLRRGLGRSARKVPRFQAPDWIVRLAARRVAALRPAVAHLGIARNATSEKALRLLDWRPRPAEEAVVATAESLAEFGLLAR